MFHTSQFASRRSSQRWPGLTAACLVAVFLAIGASQPAGRTPALPEESVVATTPQKAIASTDSDVLGIWIKAARESHQIVRDYRCTFVKRERIEGVLQEEQTAQMQVRVQPFSVHMKFIAPKSAAGREAVYVAGRHNNKLRAKGGGALSLVGFVSMDPHDARAMQCTRHTITEAGIGNMLARIVQAHDLPRPANSPTRVTVGEVSIGQHACIRFDVIDPTADGARNTYRSVIYFDKATNLPMRYEAYDRPRTGGDPDGELLECYSYLDCHFNLNLSDAAFNY